MIICFFRTVICNDFTIDYIVFLNSMSTSFHWEKKYTVEANSLGQNAQECWRFTPRSCGILPQTYDYCGTEDFK